MISRQTQLLWRKDGSRPKLQKQAACLVAGRVRLLLQLLLADRFLRGPEEKFKNHKKLGPSMAALQVLPGLDVPPANESCDPLA